MGPSTGTTKSVYKRNKANAYSKRKKGGGGKGQRHVLSSQSTAESTTEVASLPKSSSSVKDRKRTPGCKKCEKDEQGIAWNKSHSDHFPYSQKNKSKKAQKKRC